MLFFAEVDDKEVGLAFNLNGLTQIITRVQVMKIEETEGDGNGLVPHVLLLLRTITIIFIRIIKVSAPFSFSLKTKKCSDVIPYLMSFFKPLKWGYIRN